MPCPGGESFERYGSMLPKSVKNAEVLAALRAEVERLERGANGLKRAPSLPLGAPALDQRLPGGGLPLAALHLLDGLWGDWDDGAVTGFCLLLLRRLLAVRSGPVFWIAARRDLYALGLLSLGLDPARFVLVAADDEAARLWAMEEALREPSLAAVVGEVEKLPRRATRRLQLVAETSGVTAFALNRGLWARPAAVGQGRGQGQGRVQGSGLAMLTSHWRISSYPAASLQSGRPRPWCENAPRWQVELLRCRGAAPAVWDVTWKPETTGPEVRAGSSQGEKHATDRLDLLAALCDGPLVPPASRPADARARTRTSAAA